jgi:hypothetical protein
MGTTTVEALEVQMGQSSFAVFVATPDDNVTKRDRTKLAPRDNVVLEFGMFMGRLGRERTFLLVPKAVKDLHLPSDLLGVTLGTYNHRPDAELKQRRTAMKARADEIVERIERLQWLDPPMDGAMVDDLLHGVSRHLDASGALLPPDSDAWVQRVLNTVQERFVSRTEDAYSAWLRPGPDDRLHVAAQSNLPRGYPDEEGWGRDEGLAGRVWVTGQPAAVSELRRHPWFEPREGCENESYICVPVGAPGGPGGVLAVASDNGFREVQGDVGFVAVYAAVLSLSLNVSERDHEAAAGNTVVGAINSAIEVPRRLGDALLRRVTRS